MRNKNFFIVFEGIEGSGKSYQTKNCLKLKKKKYFPLLTRELGENNWCGENKKSYSKGLFS